MDRLTIFGLFAVTAMLVFYALEKRSPWFVLGFAGSCVLGSAYGFLQGAWPFGSDLVHRCDPALVGGKTLLREARRRRLSAFARFAPPSNTRFSR